jgi:lysophospholipase L1-like esterase
VTWLALLLTSCATPATRAIASATLAPATASPGLSAPPPAHGGVSITACAQELARDTGRHLLVVIGASFTAGVGSGSADRSWAVVLARALDWNAVVYGVSGAGYAWPGAGMQGPVSAEIGRIDLHALNPSLIIVQAGHDDIRVPPAVEEQNVTQTIQMLRAEAPRARIALLTVFQGHAKLPRALATDQAIVNSALDIDPSVIIMDPLVGNWQYQRAPDGLHPTVAGSEWLARQVGQILRGSGIQPSDSSGTGRAHARIAPIMCDYSSVGKHRRIRVPPPGGDSARIQPS